MEIWSIYAQKNLVHIIRIWYCSKILHLLFSWDTQSLCFLHSLSFIKMILVLNSWVPHIFLLCVCFTLLLTGSFRGLEPQCHGNPGSSCVSLMLAAREKRNACRLHLFSHEKLSRGISFRALPLCCFQHGCPAGLSLTSSVRSFRVL